MQWLIEICGFLAVLTRGLALSFEGMTIGGVIFLVFLSSGIPQIWQACGRLLRWSATLLAATALSGVGLSVLVLHSSAPDFKWSDVLNTTFALAGVVAAIAAILVAVLSSRRRGPELLTLSAVILATALTSSHAFARIDNRPLLLLTTGLHHLAMAAWLGGLPYL